MSAAARAEGAEVKKLMNRDFNPEEKAARAAVAVAARAEGALQDQSIKEPEKIRAEATRAEAAEKLSKTNENFSSQEKNEITILQALQNDPDPHVRKKVAEACGKIGDIDLARPILQALQNDPSPSVKARVAEVFLSNFTVLTAISNT